MFKDVNVSSGKRPDSERIFQFYYTAGGLEVNLNVLIGSSLVSILLYGPFPWKRSKLCGFCF